MSCAKQTSNHTRFLTWLLISVFGLLITACGGGTSSPATVPSVGYVVDSPVGGLSFVCGALTGTTGTDGSFHYDSGTACSFTLGKVTIGSVGAVPSDGIVTPYDLAGVSRSDALNANAVAIAQFLQSVDDRSASTYINIPATVATALGSTTPTSIVSSTLTAPQIQTQLATLVTTATSGSRTLMLPSVAAANLNTFLQSAYPNLNPSVGAVPPSPSSSTASVPHLAVAFPSSLTASNTSVGFSATPDVNSIAYWVVLPAAAAAPNQWQVIAGIDSSNAAVALSGSSTIDAAATGSFTVANLAYSTGYKLYFVVANASASGKVSQVFSSTVTTGPAPQAPNLTTTATSPVASATGSATLPITSDVTGTGYWVVLASGAAPTAAQVIAGTDSSNVAASIKGNTQMTGGSAASVGVSGLAYSTSYTLYFASNNLSDTTKVSQVLSVTIQTGPPPPPQITAIATHATPTGNSAVFSVTVSSGAKGYWVALNSTASSPSAAQVMAATDAAGSAVSVSGNQQLTAATATNITVSNLAYLTTYKVYFVAATSTSSASATTVQSVSLDATGPAPTLRTTAFGGVNGAVNVSGTTIYWRGIPYAAPPIGSLRWKAPADPAPWATTLQTQSFGKACMQNPNQNDVLASTNQSEDCLTLNIWAPATGETNLPVVVFAHGGSNIIGSGALPVYSGEKFAGEQKVVFVSLNYRLNLFGWLYHSALQGTGNGLGNSGNFGTLDIIQALKFVKNNIASFGGDPNNVTLAGHSAGSWNTWNLIASPQAAGLFSKALALSGGVHINSTTASTNYGNKLLAMLVRKDGLAADNASAVAYIASTLGTDTLKQSYLYGKTSAQLISAHFGISGDSDNPSNNFVDSIGDGVVLPPDSATALTGAYLNSVPFLVGTVNEEGKQSGASVFALPNKWNEMLNTVDPDNPTITSIDQIIQAAYLPANKPFVDCGNAGYNAVVLNVNYPSIVCANGAFASSAVWGREEASIVKYQALQPKTYVYNFAWAQQSAPFNTVMGATHMTDVPFLFGNAVKEAGGPTGWNHTFEYATANKVGRDALSLIMRQSLAAFLRTGNPNTAALGTTWLPWSSASGGAKRIIFDADYTTPSITMSTTDALIPR